MTMEVAVNTYSVRGLARAEALAMLRELDFHTVELWAGHASYLTVGLRGRRVAAEAADCGVRIGAYCIGGLFGLRPNVVDDRLARAFTFARELGVDLVTGMVDAEALPRADARARRQGVRFALENHWYTALARPRDLLAAVAGCSAAVGLTIDTGHLAYRGCDLTEAARLLGARTLHVHLKVVRPPPAAVRLLRRWQKRTAMEPGLPSDEDGLDGFVAGLRAHQYRGMLAVEHEATTDLAEGLALYRARATTLANGRALRTVAHG